MFAFRRDSSLDAKNYFDPKDKPSPPFSRNQFGGVLGGPLRTDRTFFFGAYEGLIERLGVTGLTAVPDDNARRGILPSGPVTLHPAIPRYLDVLFPHANGRSLGGGVSEYQFTLTQPTDEHFAQARVDHRFASGDSLFGRYTISNGKVDRQPTVKPPITFTRESSRNQYLTVEHRHLFAPHLLGTFKGGVNRSVSLADNVRTIDIPSDMAWIPGEAFGYLTVQGMVTEMAGDYRLPRNDRLNNYQWDQTFFWTRGRQRREGRRAGPVPAVQPGHDEPARRHRDASRACRIFCRASRRASTSPSPARSIRSGTTASSSGASSRRTISASGRT